MDEILDSAPIHILSGEVIHGRGIGKLVGMPTANLRILGEGKLPPSGVYITKIAYNSRTYCGITNVGTRPTVDNDQEISVETHILNFNQQIYGEKLEIQLFQKVRCIQRFEDFSALLEQIRKDCLAVREFFGIRAIPSGLQIDLEKHQVKIDHQELYLSKKEFDLLYMLYSNPDVSFTKEQLYEAIWHEPANGAYHAVENTVFQIRKKLKPYKRGHDLIRTVTGYGYKYNVE